MHYTPNILIVDDDPRFCDSLKVLLGNQDYQMQTSNSGKEAMEYLVKNNFDLALLDMVMPEMNGHEIMDYINSKSPETLVIVITGHASMESAIESLRRGAYDYLRKPFEPEELLKTVENALNRKRLERDSEMAKEALHESEEFSSSLLNNSLNPILVINPDTSIRYVNPALEGTTGFSSAELIGRKAPYPWWTEETLHKTGKDFEEAIREGARRVEEVFQRKNGERFWVEITSSPVKKNGEFQYYLTNWVETTERRRAEEALRTSQEYARNVIDSSLDMIIAVDTDRNIVEFNKAAEETFGYRRQEIVGTMVDILYANPQENISVHKKTVEEGQCVQEILNRRKSGEVFPSFLSASLLRDAHGEVVGVMGVSREITESKKTEEALRESEEKYRSLFESMLNGFAYCKILLDENNHPVDFVYLEVNDSFEKLTGLKKEDVVGKKVTEAIPTIKDTHPELFDIYGKVALTGKEAEFDIYFEPLGIWLSISVYSPQKGYFVAVFDNVTEHKLAEEALKESEEKYRSLVESTEDSIYLIDRNCRYLFMNQKHLSRFGLPTDKVIGKTYGEFHSKEETKEFAEKVKAVFETSQSLSYEHGSQRDDGYFLRTLSPVKEPDGRTTAVTVVSKDIIALKRTEEVLRESEVKYRTILESIEDGYFEVDIRGNFTFFNDSLCKIHGYSKHKLMGMNNREYVDEETAKKIYQAFNKVYTTGEPAKGFEWEIIRKDRTKRYVQSSVSLIKDAEGQRIGFRGIVRDVTEKKQTETELTQTKDFLENILDSSIDGITTTDLQGDVIYTSPRTKDILGYKQKKIIGKEAHFFYGNGKEDAKAIMKELKAKGELRDHEMKMIRKDGELIDINLSASLLRDEKGEVIGTLGIYRDITEKNRLEAQLAQAQRVEALGTLAGGIAHNFNNLLMSIQGNASLMLLDKTSSDPDYERLRNIEKSVQNGSRLTRQLLGYAREGRYEIRPISLNQVVEETSNTFGTTKKEITVHQYLAKDLYGIKADQGQIEQVLLNLYVNASDAMPGGGDLTLKTMNVTHKNMSRKPYKAKSGDYVLLTVRDIGMGMDKKTQARIFDPFFTTKGLAKGTGLGLASTYGIVKAHGGYIDVDSRKGHGTTFRIYLPASERKVEKPAKSAGHIIEGAGTILLVDDEEMVLDVGAQLLKTLGYTVLEAKGGREAVEIYRENKDRIDMVLLDMIMPDMGGGEAYDRMKKINPNIKVLLSSGYSIDGQATEIVDRGCDGFIQKPFNMKVLSQEVRKILDT